MSEGKNAMQHSIRRQNVKLASRENAEHRRCPKCDRKAALGREVGDRAASIRVCRYCNHVRFIDLLVAPPEGRVRE